MLQSSRIPFRGVELRMQTAEVVIGIASVVAVLISPLVALQVQKYLDARRESYNRKLSIFKNLMMYRVTPLSPG
jgi:hypothetical protein